MKTCSECKILKDVNCFGTRLEKRGNPKVSLMNICLSCNSERRRKRYQELKNDFNFLEKKREKAKRYYQLNRDKVNSKNKATRDTPQYKEWLKRYYKENWDKISKQESRRKHKYIEKERAKISNQYALNQICCKGIERAYVTQEMIDQKKLSIAIFRITKLLKKI